jgi:hypothetical protein
MITLSKVSEWYPNFSGAESLLDGSRQGRSRRGVRSIGLWQVDAHQMRQRWRDLASTVRSEPDSASGSHGHALRRRGERNAGNGARRGRHVHVHHDGSGRVLAEWGKPSTSTASPSRRCNTPRPRRRRSTRVRRKRDRPEIVVSRNDSHWASAIKLTGSPASQ